MAELGSVLRGLGSVLNPQVMQSNDADIRARQAQEQQMQNLMLGQVIKGVESGAIDPSKLAGTPLAGVVGVSPEAQARQQALAQEKGFRDALAQLGPDASEDDIAKTAVKFGKPEIAAQYAKAKEDRAFRVQQAADNLSMRQQQLDQQKELALSKAADQKERDAINAGFRQQSLALQSQIAASNAELRRLGLNLQADKMSQAKDQQNNKAAQQLGTALEKAGLPEINTVLGSVEKILTDRPDLTEYISGPKAAIPDMLAPKAALEARQAFNKLFNITLKNRSGAAVTNQELERLKSEFGAGVLKRPEQIQTAINKFREIVNNHGLSIASGYGPDALQAYNSNAEAIGAPTLGAPKKADKKDDPLGLR